MRPSHRLLAALALAGLMGAAQVAPLLHLVLVRHVTCAHGELVHASPEAPPPVADDAALTRATTQGDDHDHCLTLSAQPTAVLGSSARLAVYALHERSSTGSELPAFPTLAALELAPKASPPV